MEDEKITIKLGRRERKCSEVVEGKGESILPYYGAVQIGEEMILSVRKQYFDFSGFYNEIKNHIISTVMRLQFELKSIKISPVCHIQLARHADEFKGKYATGQLYGALYEDEAHITNIMAFPDADMMNTKE